MYKSGLDFLFLVCLDFLVLVWITVNASNPYGHLTAGIFLARPEYKTREHVLFTVPRLDRDDPWWFPH